MSDTSTKRGEDEFHLFIPVLRVFASDSLSNKKVAVMSKQMQADFEQLFIAMKKNFEKGYPGIRIGYEVAVNQRYKEADNDSE